MAFLQPYAVNPNRRKAGRRNGASMKVASVPRRLRPQLVLKSLLLTLVVAAGAYGLFTTPRVVQTVSNQRVEQVNIEGEINHVSEREVLAAVNKYISESLLLVDMQRIKTDLESMPWIRTVTIRREWPDTLVLGVTEEKAIARWGDAQLLNQDGSIFSPASIVGLEQLAILTGPEGSERQVMEQYQLFNQLLYQRGLKIAELILNDRGAWRVMLGNGVEINVGKSDVMTRMRRLVAFIDPSFLEQMPVIESIDLRYVSGIAIKNKSMNNGEVVSL